MLYNLNSCKVIQQNVEISEHKNLFWSYVECVIILCVTVSINNIFFLFIRQLILSIGTIVLYI